jgi:hypothetical protein
VVAGCFMACLSYLLMLLVNIRNAIRGRAPDTMASSH